MVDKDENEHGYGNLARETHSLWWVFSTFYRIYLESHLRYYLHHSYTVSDVHVILTVINMIFSRFMSWFQASLTALKWTCLNRSVWKKEREMLNVSSFNRMKYYYIITKKMMSEMVIWREEKSCTLVRVNSIRVMTASSHYEISNHGLCISHFVYITLAQCYIYLLNALNIIYLNNQASIWWFNLSWFISEN